MPAFRTNVTIVTGKETILANATLDLSKKLKKTEIEELEAAGYIVAVEPHQKSLEELLDADPAELNKSELIEACKHFKLPTTGKVDELRERVERFGELLDADDLHTLTDEELAQVANYAGVEVTDDKEATIEAIEKVL